MMSVPVCVFRSCVNCPSSLQVDFSRLVHPSLLVPCTTKISCSLGVYAFHIWFHFD